MKTRELFLIVSLVLLSTLFGDITITGTVLNSLGAPVPDFEIQLMDEDYDTYESTLTRADGTYTLVSDWDGYWILGAEIWDPTLISPVEYELETVDGETYSGYDFTVHIETEFAYIEGTVNHWSSMPASGRIVTATGVDVYIAVTDLDGYYELTVLPGHYRVMLDCETEPYEYNFEIEPGETRSGIDFDMLEIPEDGYVDVSVFNADSSPLSGATIQIISDFVDETATTDDEGFASFEIWGRHEYYLDCTFEDLTFEPENYVFTLIEGETREFTFTVFPEDIKETIIPDVLALSVHPNPFNSAVEISLPENSSKLEIFDITGKLISTPDINGKSNIIWQPEQDVNSGIYMIRVKSESGKVSSDKIIYMK